MIRKVAALAVCLLVSASTGATRADFIYGGRAYGAVGPPVVLSPVADTGLLPAGGGVMTAHQDNFTFMGLVTSGALDAKTMGIGGVASSDASVATFHADLTGLGIPFVANADLIESHTKADGNVMPLAVTGSAMFTNLVVNGMMINPQLPANTTVDLGAAGFMMLNEETVMDGQIIVNAVHVHLTGVVDIFLAHTESSISSQQAAIPEPATLLLSCVGFLGLLSFLLFKARSRWAPSWSL